MRSRTCEPAQRELLLPRAAASPMPRARPRGARSSRPITGSSASIPMSIPAGPGRAPFSEESADVLEPFRPEVVSFHFGLPAAKLLARVKSWGSKILSSATTVEEALWLEAHGADAVIAQGLEAGGHRGMFLTDDITDAGRHLGAAAAGGGGGEGAGDRRRRHRRRARHRAPRSRSALPRCRWAPPFLLCHGGDHQRRASRRAEGRGRATYRAHQSLHRPAGARIVNRVMRELGPMNPGAPPSRSPPRRSRRCAPRPRRRARATSRRSGAGRTRAAAARSARPSCCLGLAP